LGLQTSSPQAVAYAQYQHAYSQALQNYKNQQLTAQASSDPNIQSQWQSTVEPQLRAATQSAESDWEQKGFKAQIEQALTVEQNCAAGSPQLRWTAWSSLFNPDLDLITLADTGQKFAPLALSPSNLEDQGGWPTFTLAGPEIQKLISQAPT